MDSGRLQPAFYGGLFIGVLSALPGVQLGNCCCCLWAILGGMLAVYLRQQNSPYGLPSAEGALTGLIAGAIGGVIGGILTLVLTPLLGPMQQQMMERWMAGNQDMPPEMRDMMDRLSGGGAVAIGILINFVAFTVFGLLGGLLGVAVFKKNAPAPPPPGTVDILPPE